MDSLTQIVLGAAVGEYISGKKLGNRALLYGAILGTVPDLDVVVGMFYDIVTSNEIHRTFSHSLLFFVLASPIFGWLLKALECKRGLTFREATSFSFWCLFTHALLDAFTNWGTQLFWPIDYPVSIQSIFVVDPLYTLPFIYCLINVMRFRCDDARRRIWNRRGIIISSSYLLLSVILQGVAKNQFANRLREDGIVYKELSVRPAPLNTILWHANVATSEGYLLGEYSFFDTKPISFVSFPHNPELLKPIRDEEVIKRLIRMSEGWYLITRQNNVLYFNDLRFGLMNDDPSDPEFVFRYEMRWENSKLTGHVAESPSREQPKKLLHRLWRRIFGN